VQAHSLGEVDILDSVLLRVSSGTILPIFNEIGSYLTEKEQKISWHSLYVIASSANIALNLKLIPIIILYKVFLVVVIGCDSFKNCDIEFKKLQIMTE